MDGGIIRLITRLSFILIISCLFHSSTLFSQQDRLAELKKISTLEGKPFFDALDDYYFLSYTLSTSFLSLQIKKRV